MKNILIVIIAVAVAAGVAILASQYLGPKPAPSTQKEITQSTDGTTGWKVYRNEKFGFTIKIPNDWNVVEDRYGGILFCSPETASRCVSSQGGPQIGIIRFDTKTVDKFFVPGGRKQEIINGINFEKYISQGIVNFLNYETKRDNIIYHFQSFSPEDSPSDAAILTKVISTIEFIL